MSAPGTEGRPPHWLRAVLGWALPADERRHLRGEMDELYRHRLERDGRTEALLWYLRHTAAFALRFAWLRAASGMGSLGGSLVRDLRISARILARRPGYAVTSLSTLALGLGGAAIVYAAANWALLRPVPGVGDPDGLVTLRLEIGEGSPAFPVSHPDLAALEAGLSSVSALAAAAEYDVNIDAGPGGAPQRLAAALVTLDYFEVLGMSAYRGRLLGPGVAGASGEEGTAVVSHRLWRETLGGRRSALGTTLRVNGHPYTVVGVAPPGFHGAELPGRTQLWLPASAISHVEPGRSLESLADRGSALWTNMVGRAAPGATPSRITTEGARVMASVIQEHGRTSFAGPRYVLGAYDGVGLTPRARRTARRMLNVLGAGALLLLLLACANAASLALAHASARSGASSVHRALGASGARVARLVLVEHLILGTGGGALAMLLTAWGLRLFSDASLSRFGASLQGIELDARVLAFVAALAVGVALLTGLAPALAASRGGILPGLRGQVHGSRTSARIQAGLVVAQVALSAMLLVGAGLMARTVVNLASVELGFEASRALRFSIDPRGQGYDEEEVRSLLARLEERLAGEPGVVAAGFVSPAPVTGSYVTDHAVPPWGDRDDLESQVIGAGYQVTAGFLEAMGLSVVGGRWYEPPEALPTATPPPLAVISETVAREVFPGTPPGATPGRVLERVRGEPSRVVGVVRDVRFTGPQDDPIPVFFRPWGDGPAWADIAAVVRTSESPAAFIGRVRSAVASVAPELPVYELRPLSEQVDRIVVEQRLAARLAAVLAAAGVLLTAVGLYGVLGYTVSRRRREIAVRRAMGARSASVVGRFVRHGVLLTIFGLLLGLLAAAVLAGSMGADALASQALLFGVEPLDGVTFAVGTLVILAVGTVAAAIPAIGASRVGPMEVLSER